MFKEEKRMLREAQREDKFLLAHRDPYKDPKGQKHLSFGKYPKKYPGEGKYTVMKIKSL